MEQGPVARPHLADCLMHSLAPSQALGAMYKPHYVSTYCP